MTNYYKDNHQKKLGQSIWSSAFERIKEILLNKSVKTEYFTNDVFNNFIFDEIKGKYGGPALPDETIRKLIDRAKKDVFEEKSSQEQSQPQDLEDFFRSFDPVPQSRGSQTSETIPSAPGGTTPSITNAELNETFDEPDLKIINTIYRFKEGAIAFKKSDLPKTTFYRRLKKLCLKYKIFPLDQNNKIIEYNEKKRYSNFILNPAIFSTENLFFFDHTSSHGGQMWDFVVPSSSEQFSSVKSANGVQNDSFSSSNVAVQNNVFPSPGSNFLSEPSSRGTSASLVSNFPPLRNLDDYLARPPVRSHNLICKFLIKDAPQDLTDQLFHSTFFKPVYPSMKNWFRPKFTYKGDIGDLHLLATVHFNLKKVVVYLDNIWGDDPEVNEAIATSRATKIMHWVMDQFPGLTFESKIEFYRHDHALVHDLRALEAKKYNLTLKGQNWEADASHGKPEIEAVHKTKAAQHLREEIKDLDFKSNSEYYFRDAFADIQSLYGSLETLLTTTLEQEELLSTSFSDICRLDSINTQLVTNFDLLTEIINDQELFINDIAQRQVDQYKELLSTTKNKTVKLATIINNRLAKIDTTVVQQTNTIQDIITKQKRFLTNQDKLEDRQDQMEEIIAKMSDTNDLQNEAINNLTDSAISLERRLHKIESKKNIFQRLYHKVVT